MIYRVKLDGSDILDYQDKRYTLLDPALELSLGGAGSFTFTMPPSHEFYGDVRMLTSDVEVYEDEELVWFGRPVEIRTDFYRQMTVYCEGALAFLNDSVQMLHEYESISLHAFFALVLAAHNGQVAAARRFQPGTVTVPDRTVYRKLNYEPTLDVLKRQCVGSDGGYLLPRRENGTTYLDWYADMPGSGNQPAELGLNLLDILGTTDGSKVATCVLPLGDAVEDGEGNTGDPLTVESVNGGSPVIDSEAAATYGRITKAVTFSGVTNPGTLYEDGLEYLASSQFADLTVTCKASDVHLQNPNYDSFRLGQVVRCHSTPHLLDRMLGITEMSLRLDTEQKDLTLGSVKRTTLTDILNENSEAAEELEEGRLDDIEELCESILEEMSEWEDSLQDLSDQIAALPDYSVVEDLSDRVDTIEDELDLITGGGGSDDPDDPDYDPDYDPDAGYDGPSMTDMNESITDMGDTITDMGDSISGLSDRLDALEQGDGWVHQVNGNTQASGTINFVTTT